MEIQEQLDEWLAGNPAHNQERQECCPDFSCCKPELLASLDVRQRFCRAVEENDTDTQMKMLSMFLGAMLSSEGKLKSVYMSGDDTNHQQPT